MALIKICGITNLEDALAAVGAGADALGFNFWPGSKRYVAPSVAREIISALPKNVLKVGVFVDADRPEEVAALAREVGLSAVQLHGSETPDYCARVASFVTVIKALRVALGFSTEQAMLCGADTILLDAYSEHEQGGTGLTFDWAVARGVREKVARLYLAGGLTPVNVARAVREVEPFAVDVCSGVESSPGRKDSRLMRAFVDAVRAA